MAKATNADVKNNELSAEELAQQYTGALVEKALEAERVYATYSQEQVDNIVAVMALAGSEASLELAKEAHAETGRGVVEDKDIKNHFATMPISSACLFVIILLSKKYFSKAFIPSPSLHLRFNHILLKSICKEKCLSIRT